MIEHTLETWNFYVSTNVVSNLHNGTLYLMHIKD